MGYQNEQRKKMTMWESGHKLLEKTRRPTRHNIQYYASGLVICVIMNAGAANLYQENWTSLAKHISAPEWFQDAKFGIYFHWGVYSVPAFGNEWYPRNMYNRSSGEYNNHMSKYGDPFGNWQYHNFINGANDKNGVFTQFAPKLKSVGGKFDPEEWASLFDSAGAKFAGPVAEHHDGFSMWDSKVNEWNCMNKGPKLDLAGLFAKAFREKGMKFVMTTHHAWNFTGYWEFPPVTQTDNSLKKLYGQLPVAEENQLWYDKLKEIIDNYQPDLIWHDLYLARIPENLRLKFLAYYYNKSIEWNKDVVVTSKDGFKTGEMHDYERGGPADITYPYWLTDDAISSSSWCYTNGIQYYSTVQMLHSLIDRVSKNGNMMLNISPMADGSIPQGQKTVLLGMGDWLRKFGQSIYKTRAWLVYGEGPTTMGGGAFTGPKAGTNKDFRFTRTKDSSTVYAICLGWPGNGTQVKISSITSARFKAVGAYLLGNTPGTDIKLDNFNQNTTGVTFNTPSNQPYTALAYVFKVVSDRSTDINKNVAVPECRQIIPAGKIIYGSTLSNELIKNIRNGHKIYTLQGKKVKNIAGSSTTNGKEKRAQSNQVYYIRYEQDGSIKKK
jgi:alpha-L-fucosidase